jgi:hypothetical protein
MKKLTTPITTLTMIFGCLFVGYGSLITSVWSGESQTALENPKDAVSKTTGTEPKETRIIYGTVEGITDTHIKVDSGEVGEITPRYLEVEKLAGKEDDIEVGDRLKIVIGSQNMIQDYSKVEN